MSDATDLLITTLQEWIEMFVRRSMRSIIFYAKQNNMSMSQMGALFQIHRNGVCGISDIGDGLGVTSAAASQMIDRLVQQGLVARTEDPNDRRAKQIILTDQGRQVVQESIHVRQSWFVESARNMTPAEQEQVRVALNLLSEKAKQLDADGRQETWVVGQMRDQ